MPGGGKKGGKSKKRGKKTGGDDKRELVFKEEGQEYAQVLKMLGNNRLEAFCFDGVKRLCHIRGKMRRRVWIGVLPFPSCPFVLCSDPLVRFSPHPD